VTPSDIRTWIRYRGGPSVFACDNASAWLTVQGHKVRPRTLRHWSAGDKWPLPAAVLDVIELDIAARCVTPA